MSEARKFDLVLSVRIADWYADDLPELAKIWRDGDDEYEPTVEDMADVVRAEWLRPDVGITAVTIPGDKCTSDDFMVISAVGHIVGASVVERDKRR